MQHITNRGIYIFAFLLKKIGLADGFNVVYRKNTDITVCLVLLLDSVGKILFLSYKENSPF